MSDNQAIVRYSFRLRPGKIAETRLMLEWNCARYVWNKCVEAVATARKAFKDGVEHEAPTFCRMAKKLTAWRAEFDWLREGSQVVQQQSIRRWSMAYEQAFKQAIVGFPKFKSSKTSLPSLEYTSRKFRLKEGVLRLSGGISIPIVWSRELPNIPTSCVITRDRDGHWYVCFIVRRINKALPHSNASIGIDWGVQKVATTTNQDFDLSCGNQTKKNEKSLKLAQRKLARAVQGSKGRNNAKKLAARIHIRIARQRRDRAFKWARKVVIAFGRIAIEDFKPGFLSKTKMARKAADGAVGMTKKILISMAEAAGRTVALVAPAYSTMTCGECGSINKTRLSLSMRTFVCDSCGHTADRDRNAAQTICVRAGFNPTNVDDVRLVHDFGCAQAV